MNGVIERVRAMAREAIEQYGRETHAGGEPVYPDWAYDVLAVCHAAERAPAVPPANPNGEGYGVIQDVKQARKAAKQALQAGLRGWFPAACVVLARALDEAERRTAPQAEPSDEHVSVVGMPEFDALLDHIYEHGTTSEGVRSRADALARALLARYGAKPAESADRVALADELAGVVADVEQGKGFDRVCLDTIKRVRNELLKQPAVSAEQLEVDMNEYRAAVAAMEQIDPATLPGITVVQRCALGRFAKPAGRPAGDAQPVAWVAADTLHSPHPTCVSSLAYMSQLDRDRGREYVPLYAAPVAAQTADDARDAARYRWLRNTLTNSVGGGVEVNDDALVYQKSEPGEEVRVYWYPDTPVGFYEVHGSTIDAAIDAAIDADIAQQRTNGDHHE